ncbi:hypothetical protein SELMODRAFT_403730 [Selaginella moellendorffii]|uniref:FCP1 homology domain-containing protein n=1 Tax=Selaginella moellendorffii TaxID=88036 RepID=D8QSC1_SELML|nr:hypothetical protein SELMODRAFT_403730 [Selaginella moellendorffii]
MITVFVDLDDTLVFFNPEGKFCVAGDTEGPYELAHGGKEFLQALQSIPGLQLNFFSGGPRSRNVGLVDQILCDAFGDGECGKIRVFSAEDLLQGDPPKKKLEGLIEGIELEQTMVVDDTAYHYAAPGEERHFLQIYACYCEKHDHYAGKVFIMRRDNNLIRALGLILWALEISSSEPCSPVDALSLLQWGSSSGDNDYRHNATNSQRVYDLGLEAMRRVNPELELLDREKLGIYPWSCELLEALTGEQDSHFGSTNLFDKDQVGRVRLSLPPVSRVAIDPAPSLLVGKDDAAEVRIQWIGEEKEAIGKQKLVKLPSGTTGKVAKATLEHILPVESGVLMVEPWDEVDDVEILDHTHLYTYEGCKISLF